MSERTTKILAYAAVYLIWGSTYLAMHIALATLPAYELAAARFTIAGAVLLAIAKAKNEAWPSAHEWGRSAVVALFLLVGGNTAVLWALKIVPSGIAALLVSTTPFFLALLSRTITRFTAIGIALGFAGIAILVGVGSSETRVNPVGALVLIGGSLSWSIGSLVGRKQKLSALMGTGSQMLIGGVILGGLAIGTGNIADPSTGSASSWLAVAYLTVLGSLVGFTAYGWLLAHDPPARVATYAYVNPIVAVALGALLAGEQVSLRVVIAGAVIISGVVVILRAQRPRPRTPPAVEDVVRT
jgi:drug/metabolite transporter (DMT)-like permease